MAIEVSNRQRLVRIDHREVIDVAARTLQAAGAPGQTQADIVVAFIRDREIRRLNATYRGRDLETDVLSFSGGGEYNPDSQVYLGDIVISTDAVVRQASRAGHSAGREIDELVIHGVLHLCGYDHETDQGQMNRLEIRLRRALLNTPDTARPPKQLRKRPPNRPAKRMSSR